MNTDIRDELHRRVGCRINPNDKRCGSHSEEQQFGMKEESGFQFEEGEIEIDDPVVQIYMLSDEGCPGCDEAKEYYSKEIKSGDIKVVSTDSDLGADIIFELAVYEVPKLVAELKSGRFALVEE